ncbi:hypothetical protein TanjilG_32501 [Lupinus angustifolius]|uniref:AT-hook motif nuclear-localized protein n=1 Tax=Lupinus angustifolius TaxID=3871 RepID=A0A4P1R7P2_LUPAN|nr:PREDICTED: AT-hook motif nuclear-localized protein 28-like [Lupinus angustifolius]OIW04309.1 hypothetical protein TanjilG_32501 [Lupinus angustifolius]
MAENLETPEMFSKLILQQQQYQSQSNTHPFQLSNECRTSEDDDSHSSGGPIQKPASSTEGATIEVTRRPRGRPPGSKNKPKPPIMLLQESGPVMSPYTFEIQSGNDVVESLRRFSIRNNTGLCIVNCSGTVVNINLRQPSPDESGITVHFQGCFEIVSLSAIIFPHSWAPVVPNEFSITVAGLDGRIAGGFVVGRLIAAGTVYVVAASFNNQSYHRLPSEEEVRINNSVYGVGDVLSLPVSGGADVIWDPTARPPPPPF